MGLCRTGSAGVLAGARSVGGEAADGAPVVELADHFFQRGRPVLLDVLSTDNGEQLADALEVPLIGSLGALGRLCLADQLVYQVTHAPIVRDLGSRCKVMSGAMLPDTRLNMRRDMDLRHDLRHAPAHALGS